MKTSEKEVILCATFMLSISCFCGAILPGRYNDITTNKQFGCGWQGGLTSSLTCVCQENAEELIIEKNSIPAYDTMSIEINQCKKVIFGKKSIADMRNLRNIYLKNIENIKFEENSLNWFGYKYEQGGYYEERFDLSVPSLNIAIINSNISFIASHTFSGRINEITLDGVIIHEMSPFGFSNLLQTEKILIKNCNLKSVKLQSFKKFGTENLILTGTRANILPSRTFSDVMVYKNFIIDHCQFNTIRPGAFTIINPSNFEVTNTNITQLDGEAFKVTMRGGVLFKNNTFSIVNDCAFSGITLNREQVKSDMFITFDSNVFSTLTRDSLSIGDFNKKIINLNINQTCNCKDINHNIKQSEFYSEIRCHYNDEYVTIHEYKSNMCSIIGSYTTTFIVIGVVLFLIIIIGIVFGVYYRKIYKSKKYGNKNGKTRNLSLIVPDGKTYRETELHVIVERTDLLTTDL